MKDFKTFEFFLLYRFVADKMGGSIEKGQLPNFSWELPLSQVKFELKSNVIPIGKIKAGIHIHRALLFKVSNGCWKLCVLLFITDCQIQCT